MRIDNIRLDDIFEGKSTFKAANRNLIESLVSPSSWLLSFDPYRPYETLALGQKRSGSK